jgi:hypothetical protein
MNASMPAPSETVTEQVQNKLAQSDQPQGIASLNPSSMMPATDMANPAPAQQNMDAGVSSLPINENMFNENNYANGGIVAFAAGDLVKDPYAAFRMPIPKIPTADDLVMETQELKSGFVDPDFYKKRKQDLEAQTLEDIKESREADKANVLFKLAEGFGTTPGGFVRGAVAAGVKAGPAIAEMNKNIIAAKRLNRAALNELEQAKYAESIGDFKTAAAFKESARTKEFEAQKVNATLGAKLATERAKILKTAGLDEKKLKVQVEKIATEKMKAQYPGGSFETLMRDRPDVYSTELNRYKKETEDYILRDISAKTLPADYMDKLQANKANASLSGKSNAKSTKAPIAAQPANRTNLLNKYPATGSRSTNTAAEMQLTDPMYDNMGDQDDYLQ